MSLQTLHADIFLGHHSNLSALSVQIAPGLLSCTPVMLGKHSYSTSAWDGRHPSSLSAVEDHSGKSCGQYVSRKNSALRVDAQAAPQSLHPQLRKMAGSRQPSLPQAFCLNVSLPGPEAMRNGLPEALL